MSLVIVLSHEELQTFTPEQAVEAYMERAQMTREQAEIQAWLALGYARDDLVDEHGNPGFDTD